MSIIKDKPKIRITIHADEGDGGVVIFDEVMDDVNYNLHYHRENIPQNFSGLYSPVASYLTGISLKIEGFLKNKNIEKDYNEACIKSFKDNEDRWEERCKK